MLTAMCAMGILAVLFGNMAITETLNPSDETMNGDN
jgi:hypothetical protein